MKISLFWKNGYDITVKSVSDNLTEGISVKSMSDNPTEGTIYLQEESKTDHFISFILASESLQIVTLD